MNEVQDGTGHMQHSDGVDDLEACDEPWGNTERATQI